MAHEACHGAHTPVPCISCVWDPDTSKKLQSLEGNFGLESICSSHMNLQFKTKTFTQETKHL